MVSIGRLTLGFVGVSFEWLALVAVCIIFAGLDCSSVISICGVAGLSGL